MTTQNTSNETNHTNWIPEPKISSHIRLSLTVLILFIAPCGQYNGPAGDKWNHRTQTICVQASGKPGRGGTGTHNLLHYEETDWRLGGVLCKMVNPLQNVFLTNITLTMAAIAVHHCRVVYLSSPNALSALKGNVFLGSFWSIGVAVALPSPITRQVVPCTAYNPSMLCCREMLSSKFARHVFTMVRFTVVFWGPFAVMIVAYALVAKKFYQHGVITKKRSSTEKGFSTSCAEV